MRARPIFDALRLLLGLTLLPLAAIVLSGTTLLGCKADSCLSTEGDCIIESPCDGLNFECSAPVGATVRTLGDEAPIGGIDALAATGDVLLDNGLVSVVIDAIDHPHYVAPSGGNILDMTSASGDDDSLTLIFQAVGLLPGDSVRYERMTQHQEGDVAAVQVQGVLDGYPDIRVATRYELHPCEPGIRVRTEIFNRGTEPRVWTLTDGWYWSGREALPFAPGPGAGFEQEGLVSPLADSWIPSPFMAAASHSDPAAGYSVVACNLPEIHGFQTEQLSAAGLPPQVIPPRGHRVFERFITVAHGRALSSVTDTAFEIRRQLFDEPYVTLSGQVSDGGDGEFGDEVRASILIEEGSADMPREERIPWTQVVPAADGTFEARVPAGRHYLVSVSAFGLAAASAEITVGETDARVPTLVVQEPASLTLSATIDGVMDHAQLFVHPADEATERAVETHLHGGYARCAPLLGSPTGGSPACNRVLVQDPVTVKVPPGSYDVYATAGPFSTVARQRVVVGAGEEQTLTLAMTTLDLQPAGTLSADFHVHGGASFDSTVPDMDRVAAFLAARIDVLATTDHDIVWDYAEAREALGADDRMQIMVGLEATGHILFDLTPGHLLPQVIGHWNVWPMRFEATAPYRGAPWDELAEPGLLFTRFAEQGWPEDTGIIQLNHPWATAQFGRDLGFPRAVGVDARLPLPTVDDGTGQARVLRTPPGARFSNADYHTQEVMNGSENEDLLPYRAYWFYLLNQGIIRAGTANSDSHGLVDNVLGTPRNLVTTAQTQASFNDAAFNMDVRAGTMTGTNGPVIEVSLADSSGQMHSPSVQSFTPDASGMLSIKVEAAPWVPVDEIRIIVNGQVARTLEAELSHPTDALGVDGLLRFEGEVALSELLPEGDRDAWIVVEAGRALPEAGDINCDGIPDTGDNNGDGVIDWRDVDRNDDDVADEEDIAEAGGEPEVCDRDQEIGPLSHPPPPPRDSSAYAFWVVTPRGYPMSFTNPLLLNRDGGEFSGPGLPGVGQ